eukprot:275920-Rhodomonas_salina.1
MLCPAPPVSGIPARGFCFPGTGGTWGQRRATDGACGVQLQGRPCVDAAAAEEVPLGSGNRGIA